MLEIDPVIPERGCKDIGAEKRDEGEEGATEMQSTDKGGGEKGGMGICCPGTSTLSVRTGKKSRRLCAKINESDTTWRPRPLLMFVPFTPLPSPPPFCAGSISPGIVLGAVSRHSDE